MLMLLNGQWVLPIDRQVRAGMSSPHHSAVLMCGIVRSGASGTGSLARGEMV